jgi:chitinase
MITEDSVRPATAVSHPGTPPLGDPPRRRLSPVRVVLFLALVAAVSYGGGRLLAARGAATAAPGHATPAFAPYVDVTLTPTYQFQSPAADPVSSAYLGFVVTKASAPCTPTWGGFYTLAAAGRALDLDARIAQLRAQGGHAMVSFGGQANNEPAVTCTSPSKLEQAYLAPVQRYHATAIDLDVEGAGLADTAANARRAQAVAAVQQRVARDGRRLAVWLTLPVTAQGLTPQGVAAVRAMLAHHVDLTGINAMAMDFGPGQGAGQDMFGTVRRSLFAAHAQAMALYGVDSAAAWQRLGVTVMLGVNDVPGEQFTIADAQRLAALARAQGLPRVSAWSLNRDAACGGAFARVGVTSDTCSGVTQSPLQFTRILSRLKGTTIAQAPAATSISSALAAPVVDRPSESPYPIWQAAGAYVSGYKVVWHRDIYQAKWWTEGYAPDAASSATAPSPWQLIGPVGPHARAPQPRLLASAHQSQWRAGRVYHAGDRVRFHGLPFTARYYTQGDQPIGTLPADPASPWQPLFTDPGEPTAAGTEAGA